MTMIMITLLVTRRKPIQRIQHPQKPTPVSTVRTDRVFPQSVDEAQVVSVIMLRVHRT